LRYTETLNVEVLTIVHFNCTIILTRFEEMIHSIFKKTVTKIDKLFAPFAFIL